MRLEFNILWVEDQKNGVRSQRDRISLQLRKQGFKLQTEFASSVEEASKFLSSDIFGDHIDLVLMDYDLGKGPDGSAGIAAVRKIFPFKDIVFYSGKGVKALQGSVTKGRFQGVFCSSRLELPNTVFGVFDTLVKKVLDVDHSRGIVMGATSEIDHFVNESLAAVFSQGDEKLKTAALKVLAKQLSEIRKTFEKESKKIEELSDLAELAALHHVYTSAHRLRLLRKMLEAAGTHETERQSMLQYADETIPLRNELAHVRVVRSGFSRKLHDRGGKEITIDHMRELRVALLKHHEIFERVMMALSGLTGENE